MSTTFRQRLKSQREGALAIAFVFILPLLILLLVFSIDYGAIMVAQTQLQNAADAGAISTLRVLTQDNELADAAAIEVIGEHDLFGNRIGIDVETEVEYGTWDAENRVFQVIPRNNGEPPATASAVRVLLQRTRARGNAVSLFFGRIFGLETTDVRARAIAASESGCAGFVGIESITLLNNINVDSYNTNLGVYDPWSGNRNENGSLCSNGPIFLASGADVFGNAAGSSVTVAQGSGASISGRQSAGASGLEFPAVDFTEVTSNDNLRIERGPVWAPPFFNASTRDLVVNNGRRLTLNSGVYHFRNVDLAGGSRLIINGRVEIYIEGRMTFDNGTVANQTNLPANMRIFVGDGPVNIQGGHQLHAEIYAPEADVNIANGSGFFGSIIGKTLTGAGGAGWHLDESLLDAAEANGPPALVF